MSASGESAPRAEASVVRGIPGNLVRELQSKRNGCADFRLSLSECFIKAGLHPLRHSVFPSASLPAIYAGCGRDLFPAKRPAVSCQPCDTGFDCQCLRVIIQINNPNIICSLYAIVSQVPGSPRGFLIKRLPLPGKRRNGTRSGKIRQRKEESGSCISGGVTDIPDVSHAVHNVLL